MRFAFIEAEKARYSVKLLCKVLRVRRSGYYASRTRPEAKRTIEDRRFGLEVTAVFKDRNGRYGSPRVHAELTKSGQRIGRHRVARIMRQRGLKARPRRRFVTTTDSTHSLAVAPNLLDRQFVVDAPNRVWLGDVTYLPTSNGWLYLAVLLDLYSRRVVGWAFSEKNDEALTLAALRMAIAQRQPPSGLIHHSDRGTTYASTNYRDVLARHGIVCSMSRKGDCWDNAPVESFFSTLEFECLQQHPFTSAALTRARVLQFILSFYNPIRLHSSLGYRSPVGFERVA